MSDSKEPTKRKHLTHTQFFALCEELRNRREDLLARRPTLGECAEEMGKRLVLAVSPRNVRDAQKATGIEWTGRGVGAKPSDGERVLRFKVLMSAVHELYARLGAEEPRAFAELWRQLTDTVKPAPAPAPAIKNAGLAVFKVGDAVALIGDKDTPPYRYVIEAMANGGLQARLNSNRLVHVSEIRPWAPTAVGK